CEGRGSGTPPDDPERVRVQLRSDGSTDLRDRTRGQASDERPAAAWRPLRKDFSMSAKNRYHGLVMRALENDWWKLTHDPLVLQYGTRDLVVDLGAEQLLAAE